MNKLFLFFFLGAIIFSGCGNAPTTSELRAEAIDRAQVATLAITASIPSDTSFKHQLRGMVETAERHIKFEKGIERDRKQRSIDTFKHLLDTSAIYLSIVDSLKYVEPDYLEKVLPGDEPESFYKDVKNWAQEIKMDYKGRVFNIHDCLPIKGYKVFLENCLPKGINSRFLAGEIKLSQVFFNKERTRAFITTYYHCGNLCSAEYDIFFEKRKGKWVLISRIVGVVS